jgi:integrase
VRRLHSPVVAAYLQGILLTGARPGELCILKWEDVDFQWNSLNLRDKVEGDRTIPLTPYFAALLRDLKARNETPPRQPARLKKGQQEDATGEPWRPSPWVFSSSQSATGWLQDPSNQHKQACRRAGIEPLTLHGLRRSFGSLAEWTETPAGVVAQIMGHKPSATAEKHYRVRPLDLLRMWHSKIEAWMLEQARLEQLAGSQALAPRAVA